MAVAVVERFKQESMNGLSAGPKKAAVVSSNSDRNLFLGFNVEECVGCPLN